MLNFSMKILVIVLIVIAALSKAVKDTLNFHYGNSIFSKLQPEQWWNPSISWVNKYKSAQDLRPKFWGSTTIFVMITDAWHLFDFIGIICLLGAVCCYQVLVYPVVDFLIYYVIYTGIFELCYRGFLLKSRE